MTSVVPELTHFRFSVGDDGVALILLDVAGSILNTLTPDLAEDLDRLAGRIEEDGAIKGVVLGSAKDDFLAGADLQWLRTLDTEAATEASRTAQVSFARLERIHAELGKPVVAAIDGNCLGGGLELALACSGRVCTPDARLGQSEVKVGLIPGGGGTQRLPRLVGLATGLDLILTGRNVYPRKARRIGLVDEVVPASILLEAARQRALRDPARPAPIARLRRLAIDENPVARRMIFSQAHRQMLPETHGNYPAPPAALECVRIGYRHGIEAGYAAEAERFGRLVTSPESRALISIFFATRELDRQTWVAEGVEARVVRKVGIIGGGLMGAGIAAVSLREGGALVRVKDVDRKGIGHALSYVHRVLDRDEEKGIRDSRESERLRHRLTTTTDYSGFGDVDLVIEAVFEDLELKREVLREVESAVPDHAVFASNTSSIPIGQIAEAAERPEHVLGMHYFSPAERMPLLEVITTEATAEWATATAVAFGKRQGKTVIVVNDGPGFYTSRIIAPYMNEAIRLVMEGVPIEQVDQAMEEWGFPMGPLALLDQVGIDVAAHVAGVLEQAFGERMQAPAGMESLLQEGRKGRKGGSGLYRYEGRERKGSDPGIYELLGVRAQAPDQPHHRIQERLVLAMVNEAARCLEEGILHSARDGDIGAVMGLGFPPYTGGPFTYLDRIGPAEVAGQLEELADRHGERFRPAAVLTTREEFRG